MTLYDQRRHWGGWGAKPFLPKHAYNSPKISKMSTSKEKIYSEHKFLFFTICQEMWLIFGIVCACIYMYIGICIYEVQSVGVKRFQAKSQNKLNFASEKNYHTSQIRSFTHARLKGIVTWVNSEGRRRLWRVTRIRAWSTDA